MQHRQHRQHKSLRPLTSITLALLALLAVTTACASGTSVVSGPSVVGRPSAFHGGGLVVNPQAPPPPRTASSGSLPDSVDLDQFNPPVGQQGEEAQCVAWATGYYLRGWYAKRDGYYPLSGFAPGFLYDQAVHATDTSSNGDTSFHSNLKIQVVEGLDTQGDYFQPARPDGSTYAVADAVLTNAARYKIAQGYTDYFKADPTDFVNFIKQRLASGNPVALGIETSSAFDQAGTNGYSAYITDTSKTDGAHALFAYGYDAQGVLVENEWGTGWGNGGYAELSWGYVEALGHEVVSITPLPPTAPDWQQLPGAATAISVGADGSVWGLGITPVPGGYDIYRWDAATWAWQAFPGGAVRIAVDPNGHPWIVTNVGAILRWDGAAWQQLPGAASDIAIDKYGHVWVVSERVITTHLAPVMTHLAPVTTRCRTTGSGCTSAGVSSVSDVSSVPHICPPALVLCGGGVAFWTGSAWSPVPGTASRIAVDERNDPWIIDTSGAIAIQVQSTYILGAPTPTPTPAGWTGWLSVRFPGPARALAIGGSDGVTAAIGNSDEVWAIGRDGNLFRWNWKTGQWMFLPDAGKEVAATQRGSAWVVNANGAIFELPAWADWAV